MVLRDYLTEMGEEPVLKPVGKVVFECDQDTSMFFSGQGSIKLRIMWGEEPRSGGLGEPCLLLAYCMHPLRFKMMEHFGSL